MATDPTIPLDPHRANPGLALRMQRSGHKGRQPACQFEMPRIKRDLATTGCRRAPEGEQHVG
ncbi:hypothetical protein [Paraburkholderia caffeinilytica]|uniref:hypothetical protein n=1 Tax=Paraburkholderia caffeinilytica TaxID=1761016 RepID=UPI0038BC6DC0